MAQKILVTGAGGYIGSVATYLFLQKGFEVVAIDNFSTGYKQPLLLLQDMFGKEKLSFYEADLQKDMASVFEKESDIQAVVHYAGSCSVDESVRNPYKYFTNNFTASLRLVETMVHYNIKNIVFSSTCAVYGESQYVPLDEKHPTNPITPYGESKLMTEKMLSWQAKLKGFRYIALRYFNVCGASDDGLLGDSKKPSFHLMQNAVRGALGIEPFSLVCPVVDTPDKTPIRDYLNVVDLNEAHLQAIQYLLDGGESQIINLGTGKGDSVLEIVEEVRLVTGKQFALKKAETRSGDPARLVASNKKAKEVLGWEPKRSLEESITSMVRWYQKRPLGWKE